VEDCSLSSISCIATLGTEGKQQGNDFVMPIADSEVQRRERRERREERERERDRARERERKEREEKRR